MTTSTTAELMKDAAAEGRTTEGCAAKDLMELWYDASLRPLKEQEPFKMPRWAERLEEAGLATCGEPDNVAFVFRSIGQPVPAQVGAVMLQWVPGCEERMVDKVWFTERKPVKAESNWVLIFKREADTPTLVGYFR